MPELFFETARQCLLINGAPAPDLRYRAAHNETFGVWITAPDGCLPIGITLRTVHGVLQPHPRVRICDYGNGQYRVRANFCKIADFLPPVPYLQSCATIDKVTHYLTCYRQGGYALTIETATETHTLHTPAELSDVRLRCNRVGNCQMIVIRADCGKRKYLATLLYDGDYRPLMDTLCDAIETRDDCLILTDDIDDMTQHRIVRTLRYEAGCYKETDRRVICRRPASCADELLCYQFCESLHCGDLTLCRDLCGRTLQNMDYRAYFGDFVEICECPQYRPHRIGLCYACPNGDLQVRYFDFTIRNGLIHSIARYIEER